MNQKSKKLKDCYAEFDGTNLTIGNRGFQRRWTLTEHGPVTASMEAPEMKIVREINPDTACDFQYEGLTARKVGRQMKYSPLALKTIQMKAEQKPKIGPQRLEVVLTLTDDRQGLLVLWHVWILPDIPAVTVFCEIKSENSPLGVYNRTDFLNIVDSIVLPENVQTLESVLFRARTDRTNELVESQQMTLEDFDASGADGNILFLNSREGKGLFILHHGPCCEDRRLETKSDFLKNDTSILALGWGIRPDEVSHRTFLRSYSVTLGAFSGPMEAGYRAVKKFLKSRYPYLGQNRPVLLANPWGDREWYEHCQLDFVKQEVEACSEIGFTDYQLDDGWQAGGNLQTLSSNGLVSDEYWKVNQERFPGGFEKLTTMAEAYGVKLGLWYAGDSNRNYRRWKDDAERLIRLRKAGTFERIKIDMTRTRTKAAERNFLRILRTVRATEPDWIVFDLDLTGAIQRPGYFLLLDYGDIFVENRYTLLSNYWPWKAARNFWMLSRYYPIQRLELEYLNPKLNIDKYEPDEPLAPANYSIDYLFATTFFSIPLFWGEPSALEREDKELLKPLLELRKVQHEKILRSMVIPIGSEPDGKSWFGFLAVDELDGKHLMTVFRDQLSGGDCEIFLPDSIGSRDEIKRLAGNISAAIDGNTVKAKSSNPGDFGIFLL